MPLPPYIKEQLEDQGTISNGICKERGSAAAPTAGLHFTEELLEEIKAKGYICFYYASCWSWNI